MQILFAGLLLLSATVLSLDPNVLLHYRNFIERHVGQVSQNRCDQEMGSRHLTTTPGSNLCRETNTFIGDTTSRINSICGKAGAPFGTFTKSLQPFPITICKLRNQNARHPHCQYRGRTDTRYLVIRCEEGVPVHFERDIVSLG
ncbi:ribonuclease-like [Acanthopagrus latus]|uniref:ribonuclease-like n=1 Tax=Acanthopagrus latus TaxID=8177 RepID=UPI00187C077F|nr:ribonuclease-like [Acanthopagrus latus]